jgi:hypothetical protein
MRDPRLIGLATFAVADARRVSALFDDLPGVLCTSTGRAGGRDAVQVEFDPDRVSYAALLEIAAQAPDVKAVFVHSPEQARLAGGRFPTERAPLFYRGEERSRRRLDAALA